MCFSATASFSAAAATGAAGIFALSRAGEPRERPLAAVPLVFAVQQAIEGMLWLQLDGGDIGSETRLLAATFTAIALLFWPVYAPLVAVLVERNGRRRLEMMAALVAGLALTAYTAVEIFQHPYTAKIAGHTLSYTSDAAYPPLAMAVYLCVTCGPMLLSSQLSLRVFGLAVSVGLAVSAALYFFSFLSVWCFFAAAASVAIVAHFAQRQQRRGLALVH